MCPLIEGQGLLQLEVLGGALPILGNEPFVSGRNETQEDVVRADALDLAPWRERYDWPRWREALRSSVEEEAFGQRLQEAGRRGRPFGDPQFVESLERQCGRRIRARPVGRPRKLGGEEGNQLSLGNGV